MRVGVAIRGHITGCRRGVRNPGGGVGSRWAFLEGRVSARGGLLLGRYHLRPGALCGMESEPAGSGGQSVSYLSLPVCASLALGFRLVALRQTR